MGSKNNCSYSITLSLRVEDYNNKTIETTPKKNNLKLINNKNIIDYNNLEKGININYNIYSFSIFIKLKEFQ